MSSVFVYLFALRCTRRCIVQGVHTGVTVQAAHTRVTVLGAHTGVTKLGKTTQVFC